MEAPENILSPKSIPDLSHLATHTTRMALRRIFQSAGPKEYRANVLQLNAVRLADMALSEYSAGRDAILDFHAKPRGKKLKFIFRAAGHFENCMWALQRFVKHANVLRRAQFVPTDLKRVVPRHLSFLKPSAEKQITGLRDTLAHLEERALEGNLPQGSITMLLATDEGLCLGDHLLIWNDLTAWLQDMHKCAADLADYIGDEVSGA